MPVSWRSFWIAKDVEYPDEYQDAFAIDPDRGVAAIADGVTSGIFSGLWARILTEAIVNEPQIAEDSRSLEAWLAQQRTAWRQRIDVANLPWNLRPKLIDGAMSTLLWVELRPSGPSDAKDGTGTEPQPASPRPYQLRATAIGDCCLFHVRGGQLLGSFPMNQSEAFGLNPRVIRSTPQEPFDLDTLERCQCDCLPGDLLVLATDALALWAIQRHETGDPIVWADFWGMAEEDWACRIADLRQQALLRYDDTTLVLLNVLEDRAATPSELAPSAEDQSSCPPDQDSPP